jgi:ribosomal protein S18 acetylase RimI-like enzyme
MPEYSVREVGAADVVPLRLKVLRPGRPAEEAVFPGDDDQKTWHVAAFDSSNAMVGIASIYLEPRPDGDPREWRLRGMAVEEELQGAGIGRLLVDACLEHVRQQDGTTLWCNAREVAIGFYARLGFHTEGAMFDIPTVGPHVVMWREVQC